jgi:energy-coupling factor transport system ATP-binding protein
MERSPIWGGRATGKSTYMQMLSANQIRFRYDTEKPEYAIEDVSLEIRKGEFVAVLGANGCGKSTLAKHFNAILLPEAGTVTVEGMDTADEKHLYDIRQKVGMVFQNPDNQIVATVVEEDVAFALENLGVPPKEIRTRIDEAMQMAGIYKYKEKAPHKLSGGQKQRVAIAGVIAMKPDCLVLDEATAMLDPRGREKVMKTIRSLNRDYGITVAAITHYMEEAAQADRVVVMSKGRIVLEGTPKEAFSQTERLKGLHLDVPQAAELRDELVKAGIPMPEGIIDTEECAEAIYALLTKGGAAE